MDRLYAANPHLDAFDAVVCAQRILPKVQEWLAEILPEDETEYCPDYDTMAKDRRMHGPAGGHSGSPRGNPLERGAA